MNVRGWEERWLWPYVDNSGEVNGNARLTADQVSSIRADSRPVLEIAAEFGINKRYVYRIKAGERWKPH